MKSFSESFGSLMGTLMGLLGREVKEGQVDFKFDARWGIWLALVLIIICMVIYAFSRIDNSLFVVVVLLAVVFVLVGMVMARRKADGGSE